MIELLNSEQVKDNFDCIKSLLKYCRETSSGVKLPDSFYEDKIFDLIRYLEEDKAFYFVVKDNQDIAGFLWACELNKNSKRIMHILYFAVSEKHQKKGYGKMLINAVEKLARDIGIEALELNVKASNDNAVKFYRNHKFYDEHITMMKDLL